MKDLFDLINEIMDLHEQAREKICTMMIICTNEKGNEAILDAINACATPCVNAFNALEDVLSAVEDKRE